VQLAVQTFPSAQVFLECFDVQRPGCLLLDVRMPGMSGLQLRQHLYQRAANQPLLPILFISGHGDVRMATRALQDGAFDFIEKPFHEQDLLDRVQQALRVDAATRTLAGQQQLLQSRFERLSQREHEVLDCVVRGQSNKTTAKSLGLSAKTVEVHRAGMMAKLGAHSVADVVRLSMQRQLLASHNAQPGSPG
jgi:FixJ family two-component response regulator